MQKFAACCWSRNSQQNSIVHPEIRVKTWSRNSQQNSIVDSKIELQSLYMQLRSITVCIISHAFARPTPFKVNTLILPFISSLWLCSRSWFITTHEMMPEWYCVKKYNFGIPSMQQPSKSLQKLNSRFQTLLDLRVWFDAEVLPVEIEIRTTLHAGYVSNLKEARLQENCSKNWILASLPRPNASWKIHSMNFKFQSSMTTEIIFDQKRFESGGKSSDSIL